MYNVQALLGCMHAEENATLYARMIVDKQIRINGAKTTRIRLKQMSSGMPEKKLKDIQA